MSTIRTQNIRPVCENDRDQFKCAIVVYKVTGKIHSVIVVSVFDKTVSVDAKQAGLGLQQFEKDTHILPVYDVGL